MYESVTLHISVKIANAPPSHWPRTLGTHTVPSKLEATTKSKMLYSKQKLSSSRLTKRWLVCERYFRGSRTDATRYVPRQMCIEPFYPLSAIYRTSSCRRYLYIVVPTGSKKEPVAGIHH